MTVQPGIDPARLPDGLRALHDAARFSVLDHEGTPVHWRQWGDEGPVIVLLHGGFGSWMHWAANIAALARDHRVLVPDLPGCAGTAPPQVIDSMADLARPVAFTLRQQIGDAPHLLAGFSFGAMIAGLAAPICGATGIVMLGAPHCGPSPDPVQGLVNWTKLPQEERRAAHHNNLARLMLANPARLTAEAVTIQQLSAEAQTPNYRNLGNAEQGNRGLQATTCAVLGVWGDADALVMNRLDLRLDFIAALGPRAAVQIWPGQGHWLPWDAPDAVNALLAERAILAARAERIHSAAA